MSSRRKLTVAILDDYERAAAEYFPTAALEQQCELDLRIYDDHAASAEELIERAGAAEVVVVMRERSRFPAEVIAGLDATRLIITSGLRNAAIDLDAARAHGIAVSASGGTDAAPAELTWGLVLAAVRGICHEDAALRAGHWGVHVGETLGGKVLGIYGFGSIGRQVAKYGQAFGMQVLASSRSLTQEAAAAAGVEAVSKEMLFRESDVLTVHLKLTQETRGAIGAREFGLMQRSATFINTARGALVDEDALVRALESGQIRGAGLDVFEVEPLPLDSPLRTLERVVLTPHHGYVAVDRFRRYFGRAAEIISDYERGLLTRAIDD